MPFTWDIRRCFRALRYGLQQQCLSIWGRGVFKEWQDQYFWYKLSFPLPAGESEIHLPDILAPPPPVSPAVLFLKPLGFSLICILNRPSGEDTPPLPWPIPPLDWRRILLTSVVSPVKDSRRLRAFFCESKWVIFPFLQTGNEHDNGGGGAGGGGLVSKLCPSPGDLPDRGIEPTSPALQAVSCTAGRLFTTEPPEKPRAW